MDNLNHTLFALAIARLLPARRSRLAEPALVLGAAFPDIDALSRVLGGPVAYLEYHRGITHSVVGLMVSAFVLTFVFHLIEARWLAEPGGRTRGVFARDGVFLPIALGLASHLVLDSLLSYGIRPWLPFSGKWYYGDFVFVVDPWLWLLFGAAAALPGKATRFGNYAYGFAGILATALLFLNPEGHASVVIRCAWFPLLGAIVWARASRIGERRPRLVHVATLGLLAFYIGFLATARFDALARGRQGMANAAGGEAKVLESALLPVATRPLAWMMLGATDQEYLWIEVHAFQDCGPVVRSPRGLDSVEYALALRTKEGRAWESFTRFPWVTVAMAGDHTVVRLNDARYWFTDFCTVEVDIVR